MTRTTANDARALLRRLRRCLAKHSCAGLTTVLNGAPTISFNVAYEVLWRSGFYGLTRSRPAMVRAVDRALRLLAREARKARR